MAARATGEGRCGTWQGRTSRRLRVLPASGRRGLRKARVGPDTEVVGRGRGERGRADAQAASRSAFLCRSNNV
jgi:hypothetical protein